jgi:hypothetical protein
LEKVKLNKMKAEDYYFENYFAEYLSEDEEDTVRNQWNYSLEDMVEFATKFARACCEEQKRLCAKKAKIEFEKNVNYGVNCYLADGRYDYTSAKVSVDEDSILETKNVCNE